VKLQASIIFFLTVAWIGVASLFAGEPDFRPGSHVDVQDNDASFGNRIDPETSINSGNTRNWNFGEPEIVVDYVLPDYGNLSGGDSVTVYGSGFTGATAVQFNGNPATNLSVIGDTRLTVTTPAGNAGLADVSVTVGETTATRSEAYLYEDEGQPLSLETITTIFNESNLWGQIDDPILIHGSGFTREGMTVWIGNVEARVVSVRDEHTVLVSIPDGTPLGYNDITIASSSSGNTATLEDCFLNIDGDIYLEISSNNVDFYREGLRIYPAGGFRFYGRAQWVGLDRIEETADDIVLPKYPFEWGAQGGTVTEEGLFTWDPEAEYGSVNITGCEEAYFRLGKLTISVNPKLICSHGTTTATLSVTVDSKICELRSITFQFSEVDDSGNWIDTQTVSDTTVSHDYTGKEKLTVGDRKVYGRIEKYTYYNKRKETEEHGGATDTVDTTVTVVGVKAIKYDGKEYGEGDKIVVCKSGASLTLEAVETNGNAFSDNPEWEGEGDRVTGSPAITVDFDRSTITEKDGSPVTVKCCYASEDTITVNVVVVEIKKIEAGPKSSEGETEKEWTQKTWSNVYKRMGSNSFRCNSRM